MEIPQTITQLYRDYENGDTEKILAALPNDFVLEFSSGQSTARDGGMCRNKDELLEHLGMLPRTFNSTRITQRTSWSMGVASQTQVHLTYKASGRSFSTMIAHCWSFKDGIPVHLVEYMDTALIAGQSAPTEGDAPSVRA